MARLPSAIDLQRRPAPAGSPDVRVGQIDYSPAARAAGALGEGVSKVAGAFAAFGQAAEQEQAHELDRKLVDFKLETEMELENYKRQMPPGAAGYSDGWRETYRERARAFVGGEKYENIPEKLRPVVDAKLQQHDVALHERAIRDEFAERDRKTIADLETTLGRTRSMVEASPDRLEEMHAEGKRLIDGAALPPNIKSAHAAKYRAVMEEAAATAIADSVTDRASYDRAKEVLAPHKAERVTARGVRDGIKREADGMAVLSTGSGAKFRVSADHAVRFQGLLADLEDAGVEIKADQSGGYAKRNIAGTNTASQHSFGRAIDLNWHENARGTKGKLDPELARSLAAKHGLTWGGDWKNPDPMHFEVDRSASPSAAPPVAQRSITAFAGMGKTANDASSEPQDVYDGPLSNLPLAKRRAIWGRAEAQFDKVRKGVETVIKEQMRVAGDGYLPPAPVLDQIEQQVRAIGDPALAAQYDTMLRKAEWTQKLQRAPAGAIEEQARQMREVASKGGATKDFVDEIQHVEKLAESVRKQVNENPLAWAAQSQIRVPLASGGTGPVTLERLNFASDQIGPQLARRMEQAKQVGGYYGQPPKAFTKNEVDFLKDTLRQGGKGMLGVLGMIANSAADAGIEPSDIMKEFAKDAPEVAVIGEAVASNADPRVLETAANALAWRAKQGEKFVSTIDKAQAKPDLAEYADVLSATPLKADAVRHTANLLYEYEARRQGKEQFDPELYRTTVRRIMGETEMPDGTRYGGVAEQGTGWSDGKWRSGGWMGTTPKVLVPPEVRQDSFDEMTGAIRAKDLEANPPLDAGGKPLTIGQVRSASWISVGAGRYALELKRDSDGTRVVAMGASGQPYVLDVRPLLPTIAKRKPEIFRGYDGVARGVMEPE